jgi:hypothetical protein
MTIRKEDQLVHLIENDNWQGANLSITMITTKYERGRI